jgi:chromosome segregation ATPase
MDPRLRTPPQEPPALGADLDSTDELPVLDLESYEAAAKDRLADTWVQPGIKPGEAAAAPSPAAESAEDPLQTAVANLREAQQLLASRGARLADVERALEEAHAAHAATAGRVAQLTEELSRAQAAAVQRDGERVTQEAEARAALEQREAQHATDLAAARGAAARREAELGEELARARAAAGQQAGDLAEELAAAHRAAVQQQAEHARQLGDAQAVAERALAGRDRAHAALQGELEQMQARAASYFESLQSAERRRSLFEGLLTDLQEEVDSHERGRARLTYELAGRDVRTRELEADLGARGARITDLDSQVATLAGALQQRDVELTRLRAVEASLSASLDAARTAIAIASKRADEHEATLGETRSRAATLDAELAAERRRGTELEAELAKVRGEMDEWAGALRTAQLERSGHLASIGAREERTKQLEERVAEQVEMLRTLQSASEAAVLRTQELEGDLRAAEDTIARLESQLRGRNARVAELERANQQWRHTRDETHAVRVDTDMHLAPHEAGHAAADEGPPREPAPDGATRLLIQSDGGREVVHVLGRKTSLGRTPDNDLQIDAKYISRHHAVILVGSVHTIIEDLNSTNGVQVNGRRVTRQILKDGDVVQIAKVAYRFVVRRSGEKR